MGLSRLLPSGLLNSFQGPFCSLMAPGHLQASMMPLRKLEKGALSGQLQPHARIFPPTHLLSLTPLYSEHPVQLGPSQPLRCASRSWALLYHWCSYRVAGRGTLSSIPFSSSSLVSFHFPRFSKEVSASRPCHLVCCQALSEKSVAPTLFPPVWLVGPSYPPAFSCV